MSLLQRHGKRTYCFLATLSATSFTLVFLSVICTFSVLVSLLHSVPPSVFTYYLYVLNPRQSVQAAFFCLYSLGNIYILSVPFPGPFSMPALACLSQLQASLLLQPSKQLIATDWVPDWTPPSVSPSGYSQRLLLCSMQHGLVSLYAVGVAGRVHTESAKQSGIFHNCRFFPHEEYRFPFQEDCPIWRLLFTFAGEYSVVFLLQAYLNHFKKLQGVFYS